MGGADYSYKGCVSSRTSSHKLVDFAKDPNLPRSHNSSLSHSTPPSYELLKIFSLYFYSLRVPLNAFYSYSLYMNCELFSILVSLSTKTFGILYLAVVDQSMGFYLISFYKYSLGIRFSQRANRQWEI